MVLVSIWKKKCHKAYVVRREFTGVNSVCLLFESLSSSSQICWQAPQSTELATDPVYVL